MSRWPSGRGSYDIGCKTRSERIYHEPLQREGKSPNPAEFGSHILKQLANQSGCQHHLNTGNVHFLAKCWLNLCLSCFGAGKIYQRLRWEGYSSSFTRGNCAHSPCLRVCCGMPLPSPTPRLPDSPTPAFSRCLRAFRSSGDSQTSRGGGGSCADGWPSDG